MVNELIRNHHTPNLSSGNMVTETIKIQKNRSEIVGFGRWVWAVLVGLSETNLEPLHLIFDWWVMGGTGLDHPFLNYINKWTAFLRRFHDW